MNPSRAAMVGVLVAAEVLIAGMAIWTISGHARWAPLIQLGASAPASAAKAFAPVSAGASPTVAIDDPDSRVTVTTSNDGRVHLKDLTDLRGTLFGTGPVPALTFTRTRNGVKIARRGYDDWRMHVAFGGGRQAIAVEVPPGSSLVIADCAGADVTGVEGGVAVHSQDGHIALRNGGGNAVTLTSQDGHIDARGVRAQSLTITTQDGHVDATQLDMIGNRPQATVHSDDGSMRVGGTFAANGTYDVSTQDGHVDLALAPGSNLSLMASTQDGNVRVDGHSYDSSSEPIRVGDGTGAMHVHSQDGSIRVTTNGAR